MADETKTTTEDKIITAAAPLNPPQDDADDNIPVWKRNDHSTLFGVSIRGWIAMIVIGTVCFMSIRDIAVKEPLYTLAGLVTGFYFGANTSPKKLN